MRKIIFVHIVFICLAGIGCSCAQTITAAKDSAGEPSNNSPGKISFTLLHRITGAFNFMEVDALDNVFLITTNYQLIKFNAKGDSVAVFNNVKKYGTPSLIDVSNPLRPLIYYKNFSTLLMLDRQLSLRNQINFRKGNIFSVSILAAAYDNNVWIFDEQDFKLKKIDAEGKVLSETTDWRMLFTELPNPQWMKDSDGFVYLYDSTKGFFIFDYYGSLKNTIPFLNWQQVAVSGNILYGFTGNILNSYQLQSLQLKTFTLPNVFKDYTGIKAMNNRLYILNKDAVEVYSIQ
ncbi:MAG: hypothetical protein IPL97_13105 [Niastella sp.]|nr:hypothetical protein [Niastella sp.]